MLRTEFIIDKCFRSDPITNIVTSCLRIRNTYIPAVMFFYFLENLKLVMNHVSDFLLAAGKFYAKFNACT